MSETRDPNELASAAPDVAPLAWVMDEIRTSVAQAGTNIKAFVGAKQDLDSLRNARNQVHQTHGALQLLDLRGVALLTEAIEQLLRQWEDDPAECLPAGVRTVETALAAVVAYLEGLLSGRPNQPMRLYSYYRDVLTLSKSPRVHPSDLLFPDLSRRPAFHHIEVRPLTADQLRVRRVRYEAGLLGFLRNAEDPNARRRMRDSLQDLEHLPQRGLARSFWWIVRGLLEAIEAQQVTVDIDLKRVLARLNLQLRRLIDGGGTVAERLMTDALYYVGRAGEGVPRVSEVKRLYGLNALIPEGFDSPSLTSLDADALRTLKEHLNQTKTLWGQVVTGSATDAARLRADLGGAMAAAQKLGAAPIAQLLGVVAEVTQGFAQASPGVRETLGLEVAAALLFVELGVDDLPHSDPDFKSRAATVAERLRAAIDGRPLPDAGGWMSELARKAQDRLTMGTVVTETQATLREVEQKLDRFFRNPAERKDLPAADAALDQVCGVLSVLGLEEPVAALRNVQQSVRRFADPSAPAVPEEFARMAGNVGAVGFFVESLAQDGERPRSMFRYDPATGIFSADLAHTAASDHVPAPDDEFLAPPRTLDTRAMPAATGETGTAPGVRVEPRSAASVEQAASEHLKLAEQMARQLAQTPDDSAALVGLSRVMPLLANEAGLLDNSDLQQKVARAAQLVAGFAQSREPTLMTELAVLLAPAEAPELPKPSAPLPTSQAAADRELHQIFVEEANEVLDAIGEQLNELRASPEDPGVLTTVRRAFHTLKGSSRMVGLKTFGEGAWAVEQCFNLWLAQERPASESLIQLAATARSVMRGWIAQIAQNPRADIDVAPLVKSAQRVREGDAFEYGAPLSAEAAADAAHFAGAPPEKSSGSAADLAPHALPEAAGVGEEVLEAAPVLAPAEEIVVVAGVPEASVAPSDEVKRIGPVEVSHGLYAVFLNEADECIRTLAQDVAEWRFEPARAVSADTIRRAHSLAGISGTVGLMPVHSIADPLDDLMHELGRHDGIHAPTLAAPQFDTLERAIEKMRGMLHEFAAGVHPADAPLEAAAMRDLLEVLRAQGRPAPGLTVLEAVDLSTEPAADDAPAVEAAIDLDVGVGSADMPPAPESAPGLALEPALELSETDATRAEVLPAEDDEDIAAAPTGVRDELDPELLEIFRTEANDLLPAIGGNLRGLAASPNDREVARELMRQLHTVKGSARMAGAMRLGELVHDMETRIESAMQLVNVPGMIVEDLQSQYDQVMSLFDALHLGAASQAASGASAPAASVVPVGSAIAPVIDLAAKREALGQAAPTAPTTAPGGTAAAAGKAAATAASQVASVIRVRADVLDKLVDQAGEVSIARAKLENEVGTLKTSLTDLTENIARLRGQLREVEIQADAQIQARADQLAKESAAFDPLEYDRYTRLQELTRQLAESVEDVAMVQSNMLKGLTLADTDLTSQSRLTRDLQQQLMRVRLVPFANLSERLYRVARQTAKELDKRVNLEIRGGNVEVDRGVLERMTGPFEHLVRNSIVHGLEKPAERLAAGKRETGELAIEVRQEGNEIVVVVSDDGAGLNLPRIRSRAIEKSLLGETQPVSDRDLMEMIFTPGFSTATEVTELAGRGVGMDVVRSELSGFGGRIAVSSEAGRGTRFTLYLPLTLAVTQVVLATVGARRYAVPAGMVEQVRRFKAPQLAPALAAGTIVLNPIGEVVLRPLAQLLGEEIVPHSAAKQTPVVLLRSGDDRLAVAVDDVSSNQEVVVKNVGAQVSRLAGILGATILGNGEIVLIVNPVQLIARAPEPAAFYAEPVAVIEAGAKRSGPERTLADSPAVVMVVDDSLTVRRVTQRLLERNGYDVLLAKDGVDALRQLQDVRPDVMLVDIEMPRMDGFDLTRNVRSASVTRDIPIIMITSRTAEKHRNVAFEVGVNEYLGKPYQEEELLGHIKRYLAERVAG
jgi:chemosensory pili system protein ChpA (sensor histidine kinase/response regulator)